MKKLILIAFALFSVSAYAEVITDFNGKTYGAVFYDGEAKLFVPEEHNPEFDYTRTESYKDVCFKGSATEAVRLVNNTVEILKKMLEEDYFEFEAGARFTGARKIGNHVEIIIKEGPPNDEMHTVEIPPCR